jgi:protein-tyrosine kinase
MVESIGLIERAAALLRQRDSIQTAPSVPTPVQEVGSAAPDTAHVGDGPQLILDRGQLAAFGIAMPSAERSRTAEEFRLVKRNLMASWAADLRVGDDRLGRIIMITSARPGEGKTFVALNLALAFSSEREVKALLVDADTHVDIRHSALKTILGSGHTKGIVDVLAGGATLDDALIHTNIENLFFLPAGRGGPHVPELFSSPRMNALLNEMTRRFPDRFIILDTPPCMVSSDAATMAALAGQIVFVIEAHRTQQDEIEASLSMLSACPRISLLLNKSEQVNAHFGSYGYDYGYPSVKSDELRRDKPAPA